MVVSLPVFLPDSAEMAESFEPRLKLARVEFSILTVPVVTNLSTGPTIVRAVLRSPPFSCDFGGNTTPNAGSIASRSSTGMPCPMSFKLTEVNLKLIGQGRSEEHTSEHQSLR